MNFEKKKIEQRMRQLIRFMLRYKNKWTAAGLMLVLGGVSVAGAYYYTPENLQQEALMSEPLAVEPVDWEQETTGKIVESSAEVEKEWKPNPRELNLAHFFPEGADQNDITKSLAGEAFKILMTHDEEWIGSIYDFADIAPAQMAARLGRSEKSVMGRFNPKDNRHDRSKPETWTINSFKNVRMTASDGDGNAITPYSNVLEIMSMANFYTYHKGVEDYDLFLSYSKELWELSHSYTVSMSDVYYCSGCMSEDAERREMEALEAEAKAEALGLTAESQAQDSLDASADVQKEDSNTSSSSAVIVAGKTTAEKESEAASLAAASRAAETQVTVPESTSGVITSQRNLKETTSAAETPEASPENTAAAGTEDSAAESADEVAGSAAETESAGSGASSSVPSVPVEKGGAAGSVPDTAAVGADSDGATPSDALSPETKAEEELTDCPGHVDLIIHMKIVGLDEKNNLFELDTTGGDSAGFEENGWQGWDQYAKACARILSNQDWFEKYGLTVSSISARNPLTNAEIEAYMAQLPADLSETRKDIIRFALNSVGKVPYYWGGKPSAPNYASNSFGVLTVPDYKGRVYKGLDCSGWINWVYWSVTGRRLPYESTSGLAVTGTKIQRNELQPGDIIVRTGADAHVIMFLGWTSDGRIQCIHESSAAVNNVTVATRDANWQYYRKLVD